VELKKPIPGDQIIGLSAIVLFLFSFVHWLGATGTVKVAATTTPLFAGAGSAWDFTLTTMRCCSGWSSSAT
jgi:hypothetical protein